MFKPGDIVRLNTGFAPILVVAVEAHIWGRYLYSGNTSVHAVSRYEPYDFLSLDDRHVEAPYSLRTALDMLNDSSSDWSPDIRHAAMLCLHRYGNPENEEEETMTEVLFQTKEDKPRFGTRLATNKDGLVVLDMKGGVPEAFKPSDIEEVVPYTIHAKCIDGASRNYHFRVKDGMVESGGMILRNGVLYHITELNTKNRNAPAIGLFFKIPTERMEFKDEE